MTSSSNPRPSKSRAQTRITRWGDVLGRWNPQLLRQLRGTLTVKAVILAIAVSLMVQGGVALMIMGTTSDLLPPSLDYQAQVSAETIYSLDQCLYANSEGGAKTETPWSGDEAVKQCGVTQSADEVALLQNRPYGLMRQYYCAGPKFPPGASRAYRDRFQYGAPLCLPNSDGGFKVNWRQLYGDALPFVRGLFLTIMGLGGTAAILRNWLQEVKLGTLDFIRLSPEPGRRILLGKILGAPILFYVGALAWIPFHLYLAFNSDTLPLDGFAADMFGLAALSTVFVGALAACVWENTVMVVVLMLTPMVCGAWLLGLAAFPTEVFRSGVRWYGVELTENIPVALAVGAGGAIAATVMLWQSACRRFENPQTPPLRRIQAYQIMAGFNGIALGFGFPLSSESLKNPYPADLWGTVGFFWMVVQIFTLWATLPQRQTLLDWARYRHIQDRPKHRGMAWGQWLWQERSPNLWVPVVNGLVTWVIWSPWAIGWLGAGGPSHGFAGLAGLGIFTAIAVVFSAISTACLLAVPHKPGGLLAKLAVGYVLVSVLVFGLFASTQGSFGGSYHQSWWPILLTAAGPAVLPAAIYSVDTLNSFIYAGLASGLGVVSTVAIARNTWREVGKSESKALFSNAPDSNAPDSNTPDNKVLMG